jgi:hypothetical protein
MPSSDAPSTAPRRSAPMPAARVSALIAARTVMERATCLGLICRRAEPPVSVP